MSITIDAIPEIIKGILLLLEDQKIDNTIIVTKPQKLKTKLINLPGYFLQVELQHNINQNVYEKQKCGFSLLIKQNTFPMIQFKIIIKLKIT